MGLRGDVRTPPIGRWKARVIQFVAIELFSLGLFLTVEPLYAEICRHRCFSKGVGHFEHKLQTEGAWPANHCLIAFSCGIEMSTVHCLVLSQSTCVTDGQTDGRTDRQNYES